MFLTRLAVTRPLTVLMGLLGLVIMGGVAYTFLKVDRLPPISIPFVSVNTSYPGATAQDIELLISQPIENVVSGMAGVSSITSTSSEGNSSVNVQLADGTDANQAALEVERRISGIRNRLPGGRWRPARQPRRSQLVSDHERGPDGHVARSAVPGGDRSIRASAAVDSGRRVGQCQRRAPARDPDQGRLRASGRLRHDRPAAVERAHGRQRQRARRHAAARPGHHQCPRAGRAEDPARAVERGRVADNGRADPAQRRGHGRRGLPPADPVPAPEWPGSGRTVDRQAVGRQRAAGGRRRARRPAPPRAAHPGRFEGRHHQRQLRLHSRVAGRHSARPGAVRSSWSAASCCCSCTPGGTRSSCCWRFRPASSARSWSCTRSASASTS